MGWNSWNRFGPFVSDQLVRETADALVRSGMRDAGYRYVVVDDAWEGSLRDDAGELAPNLWRFPAGMRALADDLHGRDLRFGLYTCAGDRTCQGYPGSRGFEARDARRFASWGVDFMKVDWCNTAGLEARTAYAAWAAAIGATGRPMVLSICEWGRNRPWEWAGTVGHLWRTAPDIADRWDSLVATLDRQVALAEFAGPDHWNDPDMLEVGNGGMTEVEYRAHFALWAILAAPLMAGNDLRAMDDATRAILTAPEVIAVDQDPLGRQGRRALQDGAIDVWARELADGTRAVLLLNRGEKPARAEVTWDLLGGSRSDRALVRDLWERADVGVRAEGYDATLEPHAAALVKTTRVGASEVF
ncbi:MAG TPA: glycoside hydrolase family 27 protein [Candidatus Limnocylindria bacterium]|nr:glycoside hydrolase family 27 protein [Candidatus Limnocylindria bacterium]